MEKPVHIQSAIYEQDNPMDARDVRNTVKLAVPKISSSMPRTVKIRVCRVYVRQCQSDESQKRRGAGEQI
ncbi:hypothetical protein ZHAS_00012822 [Anopheles sinensis]|uniref:Uncharacterized protein n=1 Tax=Anopheles sinensis TaxID=74873 RepID=A0A084W3W5_ANOSI|nr:hypothetical protein ZHAS_00012822 [Anopheles sinensis]